MFSCQDIRRRKRVCIVRHSYYPSDPRVRREVEALAEAGYAVDVICLRKEREKPEDIISGAHVYRLPIQHRRGNPISYLYEYFGFFTLALAKLTGLHLRNRYAVVQANNMPDFLVFTAIVPKLWGARIILDIHDLMPELFASKFHVSRNSIAPKALAAIERLACNFADHTITVTDLWRERICSRSISVDRCTVLMNVADEKIFRRRSAWARRNGAHYRNGKCELIYHGALVRRYGVDVAIKAVKIAREAVPGCHLLVLGEGEQLEELRHLVRELDLADAVTIGGESLPAEVVARRIAEADFGIVPHRGDDFTTEILPNKLLEYVRVGTPVIASRTRALQSYFDSSMLMYFEPDDASDLARCIVQLHRQRSDAHRLATQADVFNDTHDWRVIRDRYVQLVDSLCGIATSRESVESTESCT